MLKLRELRKKAGLTMKELGTELGVAESTISQYETGKRQPDYEMLLKIGEYFGVSTDYLLGKETEKAPTSKGEREFDDENLMFALFGDVDVEISEEDLADVREYARFVAERKKRQQNKDSNKE